MTPEQENILEKIKANDQHPERGEITLVKTGKHQGFFVRETSDCHERWGPNGHLVDRNTYQDDQSDDQSRKCLCECWDEDGDLEERYTLKDGHFDGLYESWYKNGHVADRRHHKDGFLEGLFERHWESGSLMERVNYKRSCFEGLYEAWYENGLLWERCNYKGGELDGLREKWNKDGRLELRAIYKNDKLVKHLPLHDDTTRVTVKKKNGLKL